MYIYILQKYTIKIYITSTEVTLLSL